MPLTPKQKAALNLFSHNQVELVPSEQSGSLHSTLTGDELAVELGDLLDQLQDNMATSTSNITLAVSLSGSDTTASRPNLISGGDYSSLPFLTIQTAIDSLPKNLKHRVVINVGAGNFAGFIVTGFSGSGAQDGTANGALTSGTGTHQPVGGSLIIRGTTSLATLATGSNTGVASSANSINTTFTPAVAPSWVADDLKNKWFRVTSTVIPYNISNDRGVSLGGSFLGELPLIPIQTNTATVGTARGIPQSTGSNLINFQVVDLVTVITSQPAQNVVGDAYTASSGKNAAVLITNNTADVAIFGIKFNTTSAVQAVFTMNNRCHAIACEFRGETTKPGIYVKDCINFHVTTCQFIGNQGFSQKDCMTSYAEYNYGLNTTFPFQIWNIAYVEWINNYQETPTAGAYKFVDVRSGILQGGNQYSGGTGDGFAFVNLCHMYSTSSIGTGISGFGFNFTRDPVLRDQTQCSTVQLSNSSTATGTSGDISLDGFVLTHAQAQSNGLTRRDFIQLDKHN